MFNWFKKRKEPQRVALSDSRRRPLTTYQRGAGSTSYQSFPDVANQRRTPLGRQFGELDIIRSRARWLYHNNSLVLSAVENMVDNIVGEVTPKLKFPKGVKLSAKERISEAWMEICEGTSLDFFGRYDFHTMLSVLVRNFILEGEAFVERKRGSRVRFEIIDPPRIPTYSTSASTVDKGSLYHLGARVDQMGRVQGWAVNSVFGDSRGQRYTFTQVLSDDTTRIVPAGNMLHCYDPGQACEFRGEPNLGSALVELSSLLNYNQSALKNAEYGAKNVGMIQDSVIDPDALNDGIPMAEGVSEATTDDEDSLRELAASGQQLGDTGVNVFQAPTGMMFNPINTKYPDGQYSQFIEPHMRAIASAVGISYASLTGDLSGVNFSSGRIGEKQMERRTKRLRRLLVSTTVRPMIKLILYQLVMDRKIKLLDAKRMERAGVVFASSFSVDPQKKVGAEKTELDMGVKSRREIIEDSGRDADEVFADIESDSYNKQEPSMEGGAEPEASENEDTEKNDDKDDSEKDKDDKKDGKESE